MFARTHTHTVGLPSSLGYVYFSEISGGTRIQPHCGCTNAKLRIQLVLSSDGVFAKTAPVCLEVGGVRYDYTTGKCSCHGGINMTLTVLTCSRRIDNL